MTLNQIIEKLKLENARSKEKHGLWAEIDDNAQFKAIFREFTEWNGAFFDGDINGEHGEIEELIDLMNVCMRRVMFLTGEWDA